MKILAQAVFEGIVYNSIALDLTNPCRPTLEVDAVLRGFFDSTATFLMNRAG